MEKNKKSKNQLPSENAASIIELDTADSINNAIEHAKLAVQGFSDRDKALIAQSGLRKVAYPREDDRLMVDLVSGRLTAKW